MKKLFYFFYLQGPHRGCNQSDIGNIHNRRNEADWSHLPRVNCVIFICITEVTKDYMKQLLTYN